MRPKILSTPSVQMVPQIELYLCTDRPSWLRPAWQPDFSHALAALVPELLATPPGPEHVLSTLACVEVSLVNDVDMARVHAEFLHDPSATDVITFPYGEILVSCDTAGRYASAHGLLSEEELFRYIVHGLTHLHGYTDATPEQRARLFTVQELFVHRFYPYR